VHWLEAVYNRRRRHSAIDMLTPVDYEESYWDRPHAPLGAGEVAEWGPGHPLWEARVLGKFPTQAEDALIAQTP
jgi:hypothetical protein